MSRVRPVSTPLPTTSLALIPVVLLQAASGSAPVPATAHRRFHIEKKQRRGFAGYITRDDCSAPVLGADPLRQKRADAQRPASRADRRGSHNLAVTDIVGPPAINGENLG